ncbi:MAG: VCBS repeat-containing protein [Pyrinomonadaceae bacterium]
MSLNIQSMAFARNRLLFCAFAALCLIATFSLASGGRSEFVSAETAVLFVPRFVSESAPKAPTKAALLSPPPPASIPAGSVEYDFDNDGKADIGRWHPLNREVKVKETDSGSFLTFSVGTNSAAKAAPGDYNGDGATDAGVFLNGTWTYKTSPTASAQTISLGQSGDIPSAGDYDGDGKTDAAVFRPSNGTWYVYKSSTLTTISFQFGQSGDIPVPGNYDGDSKTDYAIYRPGSSGQWFLAYSVGGYADFYWGNATDIPVQGNFDSDSKSDVVVYRPSDGIWYVLKSDSGFTTYSTLTWGVYYDQPVPADYDGDGITDYAVWRQTTGQWFIRKSSDGSSLTDVLGVPGDTAVPSAYTKQVGGTAATDEIAAARLNPKNATGSTDLYSQNFSWGRSLVSMPGRSGLDLGLGISYNSLVWTKIGTAMYFDPDQSDVSPGFKMGFPEIEPVYFDAAKSVYSYLMVTPDGRRVEFRQIGAGNTYQSVDSTYAQLVTTGAKNPNNPVENITIKITTTDGTEMSYVWAQGGFRCNQIKDRNGNYISIYYSGYLLSFMVDSLGRTVNINYNSNGTTTITQTWKSGNGSGATETHTYATLSFVDKEIQTSFASNLSVVGPPNYTQVRVLDKITYADTSWTKFHYNGYAQVWKVENYADDDHKLNHVRTNLESPSSGQQDVPRFTSTSSFADDFNSDQEVETRNSILTGQSYIFPHITGTATRIQSYVVNHPDNLRQITWVEPSGWREGLPFGTEDCLTTSDTSCGTRKRWTTSNWTQDGGTLTYQNNPRIFESRVGDGTNYKRTTIDYNSAGLPEYVRQYDFYMTTIVRTQKTTYSTSSTYTSRRLIALPTEVTVWDGEYDVGALLSKITFAYDEGNFSDSGLSQTIYPTQHDATNYGSGFVAGRGNLTKVTRHDVGNSSTIVAEETKYNTAGSPVAKITPWDGTYTRTVKIGYADSFNSSGNPTTYAFPTTLTDPASNSSTVKYRYDIGTNIEATSPAPAGQTYGKTTKRLFDSVGRLYRDSIYINTTEHAYTRYEFPTSGMQSKVYSTLVDADASGGPTTSDELLTESFHDGAGRVLLTRKPHSFSGSSTSTYAATETQYDLLGRVTGQSIPIEVDSNWGATGDDLNQVWKYNLSYYDWKNRVVRTRPSDSTSDTDGKDTLITYEGCGCAGGMTTVVQGPLVPRDDTPTVNARRSVKTYEDYLGRAFKVENRDWAGNVYLTTQHTINGRDQITQTTETEAATSTVRTTSATYDGFDRLATKHIPQQSAGISSSYAYNPDDSVASMTDGRGVVTNYTYNSRRLRATIGWSVGSTGITDPSDVSFTYDNAGNRTQMTDGLGTQTYAYDPLSQLTSETRQFSDDLPYAPQVNDSFTIGYTYHIGGQLKTLTEPYGVTVNYTLDKAAKLTNVAPSSTFAGLSSFASNAQYRAWGGLKHLDYGNGVAVNNTFDTALRPVTHQTSTTSVNVMEKSYQYYPDGNLKHVDDAINFRFDRLNRYDHQGRLSQAKSSSEADGTTVMADDYQQTQDLPYRQTYGYNAFGDMTSRYFKLWGGYANSFGYTASYGFSNSRITGWTYDADGRVTVPAAPEHSSTISYDGAGQMITNLEIVADYERDELKRYYDGDGRERKRGDRECRIDPQVSEYECVWNSETTIYYVRSTVLGGEVIAEAPSGMKGKRMIRLGTSVLGYLTTRNEGGTTYDAVHFEHSDPIGMSQRVTRTSPEHIYGVTVNNPSYIDQRQAEFDPTGSSVGLSTNYRAQYESVNLDFPGLEQESQNYVNGQRVNATLDGVAVSSQVLARMAMAGSLQAISTAGGISFLNDVSSTPGGLYWETPRLYETRDPGFYRWTSDTNWFGFNSSSSAISPSSAFMQGDRIKLEQAVKDCAASMFGVRLGRTVWSGAGQIGSMDFVVTTATVRDRRSELGFTYPRMTRFTVHNDSTSYSSHQLGSLGRGGYGGPGLSGAYDSQIGRHVQTNQTFTANDVGGPNTNPSTPNGVMRYFSFFESIQMHETGNALARLTDTQHTAGNWIDPTTGINYRFGVAGNEDARNRNVVDTDSGQAFELCALLGYRKLTGYK